MEELKILGIKILPCKEQLRLSEVALLYKSLILSNSFNNPMQSMCKDYILPVFLKFISNYSNIIMVNNIQDLVNKFFSKYGISSLFEVSINKGFEYKYTDDIININIYQMLYFGFWPEYVVSLDKSLNIGRMNFRFRFHISENSVKKFYNNSENNVNHFENDVIKVLMVNGFENCLVTKENNKYTIEIN